MAKTVAYASGSDFTASLTAGTGMHPRNRYRQRGKSCIGFRRRGHYERECRPVQARHLRREEAMLLATPRRCALALLIAGLLSSGADAGGKKPAKPAEPNPNEASGTIVAVQPGRLTVTLRPPKKRH